MTLIEQLQRAASLYQQRQVAPAQAQIQQTLREYPQSPDAWRIAGIIARASKDTQAEVYLRRALQLRATDLEALNALGGLLHDQQREGEAESCYQKALQLNPGHEAIRINLCRQLLAQNRAQDVLALTQDLAATTKPALWRQRGEALLQSGRPDAALPLFDQSLRLDPQSAPCVHGRIRALLELGRFTEAGEIASARSNDPAFALLAIKALAGQNHWQQASAAAEQLARSNPGFPDAVFVAAQMLWMQGEGEAADDLLVHTLSQQAGLPSDVMCAVILRGMGEHDRALATLQTAEQRYGAHPQINCARTDIALEQGDYALAMTSAEAAYDAVPEVLLNRSAFAQALLVSDQAERALPIIEATLQTLPNQQHWLALWGDALRMLGDARHHWLLNFETMPQPFRLQPPPGYASIEDFNADLVQSLNRLHQMQDHPLDQSLKFGSQTHIDLRFVGDSAIQAFLKIIEEPIAQYIAAMPADDTHPLYRRRTHRAAPSGMWSVRLRPEGQHVNHVHPQGWLSSAYYVAVPPADPQLPTAGALQLGQPRYPTPGLKEERVIPATAGNLVLFPSYMWHGTVAARTGVRITIAFDVTPQQYD